VTITPDGWLTWARRLPGPAEKLYAQPNRLQGYIPHSMVGYYRGWLARLFDMSRLPDGRFTPYAAASVHGSVLYDGTVVQHYPLTASCWASGSREANTRFVAFETEGGPPGNEAERLTPAQFRAHLHVIRELCSWRGWTPRRPRSPNDLAATLYEHREMTRFSAAPTACPSGRIDWAAMLLELLPRPTTQEEKMQLIVKAGGDPRTYVTDFITRRHLVSREDRQFTARLLGIPADPVELPRELLDAIPLLQR
jgi:hypothetical protein